MRINWDGTSLAFRRWTARVCCAAGLIAGQLLLADEPAAGVLNQDQAATQYAPESGAAEDDAADADQADQDPAALESAASEPARLPAASGKSQGSAVPLIAARPIPSAHARSLSPVAVKPADEGQSGATLAPIATPTQARQLKRPGTPTVLGAAKVQPATQSLTPARSQGPYYPVAPASAAIPDSPPTRVELGSSSSSILSVPLVESGSTASPQPSDAVMVENRSVAPASRGSQGARSPAIVENPLVTAPKRLSPVAPPAAEAEDLAPVISSTSLPQHAPARAKSPTAFTVRSAQATQTVDPAEPLASLQPLPGAEEFGQLPEGSPFETIGESGKLKLRVRRSMLLRTKVDVYRTATVDEAIVELVQFTPREISLIGRSQGQTHVTFWFDDAAQPPVTYLVEVSPDAEVIRIQEEKYKLLENLINEMFPDSKVYLVLVADKLLVKGQARDSEEAAQIMTIIRAQTGNMRGSTGYGLSEGLATPVLSLAATGNNPGPGFTIINMLRVPGVQQVSLKVKIAELNRSAARGFGVNVAGAIDLGNNGDELIFASILNAVTGGGTSVIASLDGGDLDIGIRYLQQRGVIRLLSEPTLVTLSGRPATFIAGGEFAVPTVVGNVGLNAVTTDFRAFGAIISFVPTIVDKDRIRLQVAPEFSQINNQLAVGGTPGLNVRAATTTVEMREGQTLAIAGLLEDNYNGNTVGDLPFLSQIFGRRSATHNETELIILVSPELVHPMEPEEVPPLPGFDMTEPTGGEFFLGGHIEGNPTRDHRSTVWPRLKRRYGQGGPAMTSGPFGHGQ